MVLRSLALLTSLGLAGTAMFNATGAAAQMNAKHGPAKSAFASVKQNQVAQQRQIQRLNEDLARQQSVSVQAKEQLKKRNQAIVELQRQLQELRDSSAPTAAKVTSGP